MTYQTLLFDVDDTLLDFQLAEKTALTEIFTTYGITELSTILPTYQKINQQLWRQFEQGTLSQQAIGAQRFEALFDTIAQPLPVAATTLNQQYRELLGEQHQLLGNSREILAQLATDYQLAVVTNGVLDTQMKRLTAAGLLPYFDHLFISQAIGAQKPEKAFFDHVKAHVPDFEAARTLVIGDSLTADIAGGQQAGLATAWLNPEAKTAPTTIQPTYQLRQLDELIPLLQKGSK